MLPTPCVQNLRPRLHWLELRPQEARSVWYGIMLLACNIHMNELQWTVSTTLYHLRV